MKTLIHNIQAVFLGALTAMVLIGAIEVHSHREHPPPVDLGGSLSRKEIRAAMEEMPLRAFLFRLTDWGVVTFTGV